MFKHRLGHSLNSMDFSWTRKHPFVRAIDSPGNDAIVTLVENTPQLGITSLTILFIANGSALPAFYLDVCGLKFPGRCRQATLKGTKRLLEVHGAVAFSFPVLEASPSLHPQDAGGPGHLTHSVLV